MHKRKQIVQAEALLLLLMSAALRGSEYPYLCILFTGILLLIFTMRSLAEKPGRLLLGLQIIMSAAFVAAAGGRISHLIFYECRMGKSKWPQMVFPFVAYGVHEAIRQKESLPQIIYHGLILTVVSGGFILVEKLVTEYFSAKDQIAGAVSITAVNEMYEKKLNRELIIKNYLAEKNARLEERENISRNIHNSVGHSITAAILSLDAADMLFDVEPDRAREKMNAANERIRTGLDAIRHAVRVLDTENEFILMADFIHELKDVIDRFRMDTTIEVYTDFTNIGIPLRIPHEHTEFLTGAVQELLTNGVRHGNATVFKVGLTGDSGHIRLLVSDNGKSDFSGENCEERIRKGFGLKKMLSYVRRCGGTAVFVNKNGFQSEIVLPLLEEEECE